ncbi:MAG: molybdopterin molybdotransferase MoeA [Terriglobia bacterium]
MILTFSQALETVKEKIGLARPATEELPLALARGRILAEPARADRDYPPFHRATRDGFAVRSADVTHIPAELECVGEARAGGHFDTAISPGQCVSIMTGAPLPEGADAVVMVEHTSASGGEPSRVTMRSGIGAGENIVSRGGEAATGSEMLAPGSVLGAAEIALLASVGAARIAVFRQPRTAILATGDELVAIDQQPEWFQIRNSNAASLAAQVEEAGGAAEIIGVAGDDEDSLRKLIRQGLGADLLILSGGVSAGKYDRVEAVLEELGAEFYFTGVEMRPGRPVVFGRATGKPFFGLPGNPVSAYVTFEVLARPALRALGGADFSPPLFFGARLAKPMQHKPGLTRFVPARAEDADGAPSVEAVSWQGSGDLAGLAAANCFVVVKPSQARLNAGDWVEVLPRRGVL